MLRHLSANLWLLVLTIVICAVVYPLALLGVGQFLFPEKAAGGLIKDKDGNVVGARLIAQPFTGAEYFQPRPSAVSYNAAATGGSNWGANNPALRKRVLVQLGPILKYGPKAATPGQPIGPDIEKWFVRQQGLVAQWAKLYPDQAAAWIKAAELHSEHVAAWMKEHPQEVAQWLKDNPNTPEPKPEDLAEPFFAAYSAKHPGTFPGVVEKKDDAGKVEKSVAPVQEGSDIQAFFFDLWRQEHPQADLAPVPADLVMTSGSGLDPHISLAGALYQLDRVAGKWAADTKQDPAQVRRDIEALLRERSEAPLAGVAGPPLINVLEVNLALRDRYAGRVVAAR